jgi:hypothetical protein
MQIFFRADQIAREESGIAEIVGDACTITGASISLAASMMA